MAHRTIGIEGSGVAAGPRRRTGGRGPWLARLRRLEVRPQVVGPHARLGLAWSVASIAASSAGVLTLALLLAPCAGLAAVQAGRSWRAGPRPRPAVPLAGAGAAAVVLAAVAGPLAVGLVAVVLVVVVAGGARLAGEAHADPVRTLVIAGSVGLAAASPVLLLHSGLVPVFVLLTYVHVHDASAYVVGTGAASAWEGPAAGVASIAAVTLAVAAVLVPPFRGTTPWRLGGLAALLAPLGPYLGSALVGDRRARVPALRRLDSMLVLAPVWCLVASLVLE